MIPVRSFARSTVAVFGLARTGTAALSALVAGGADVVAWDDNAGARLLGSEEGARVEPWRDWDWSGIAALVLSPGVPLTHPAPHQIVGHARDAGVPVIGDVELFAREIRPDPDAPGRAPVIAVTGTNGKSTTTALIGHILAACGFEPEVGGNIGKPVLALAPPSSDEKGPKTVYAIEMSSFQIDLAPGLVPDISVLTNLTPDHIDRHGSMENYAAIKTRLMEQTAKDGLVIVGVDDATSAAIFTRLSARGGSHAMPVSVGKVLGRGVFVIDGALYDALGARAAKVMDLQGLSHLAGAHNWQNAALAYAAVKPHVRDPRRIAEAIASFPGLAHRMEEVGRQGKVRFINDSKATNADASARALVCFPDIFWIAGGKPKEGGIESLRPLFSRIRKAYLIGEAAEGFAHALEGMVPYEICVTLERAVSAAAIEASASPAPAPVVLLSPACASYDQFRDFEQRGDAFRDLVARLAGGVRAAS